MPLTLADFGRIAADVPLLVNLQPAGKHLMEDLRRAGGLAAVLHEVIDLLDVDAIDVTGRPFVESLGAAQIWDGDVISVDVPQAAFDARPPSAAMVAALARPTRGWQKLYVDTVLGADVGADLDFLVGASGDQVSREAH